MKEAVVFAISIPMPGMSMDETERIIADSIEPALGSLELRRVQMRVRPGDVQIQMQFSHDADSHRAWQRVVEWLSSLAPRLPGGVTPRLAPAAQRSPALWLVLRSDTHSLSELSELADLKLRPKVRQVAGVRDLRLVGDTSRRWRIVCDPDKLRIFDLTHTDIVAAVRTAMSGNDWRSESRALFDRIAIREIAGQTVFLRDVAIVQDVGVPRGIALQGGRSAVALGVFCDSDAARLVGEKSWRQDDFPTDVRVEAAHASEDGVIARVYRIQLRLPADTTPPQMHEALQQFSGQLHGLNATPGTPVLAISPNPSDGRPNSAILFVRANPNVFTEGVIQNAIDQTPGGRGHLLDRWAASGESFELALVGPDLERLCQWARLLEQRSEGDRFGNVVADIPDLVPELSHRIDARKAAQLGVEAARIAEALPGRVAIEGGGRTIEVEVAGDFQNIRVRNRDGEFVPLGAIVQPGSLLRYDAIDRLDGRRAIFVTARAGAGVSLAEARAEMASFAQALARERDLPDTDRVIDPSAP